MAAFPVLISLEIDRYGLYPTADGSGAFRIEFQPGLTLILGANGLGKSTLIGLLFRMLTGPFDLQLPSGSIGTTELAAVAASRQSRLAFASRVNDAARSASATLKFELGSREITVTRSLSDLALRSFESGELRSSDEKTYQQSVICEAELATFGEWILVLRTIVFFFEDRRTLIWDPSAQRQLLRCLLLSPEQALEWATSEREILSLDRRMRNLQAALRREQKEITEVDRKIQSLPGVTAALRAAETAAERAAERQEILGERVEVSDRTRHRDRLDSFRAQATYDTAVQELERARLSSVESRFPSADESMRYILTRLMSDGQCLVCLTEDQEEKRKALTAAIDSNRCVVCNSALARPEPVAVDLSDERIDALRARAEASKESMLAQQSLLEISSKDYDEASRELAECASELSSLRDKIDALVNQLPPEERKTRKQHDGLAVLEDRVASLRAIIKEKREAFTKKMSNYREAILKFASTIKASFEAAAQGFLFENSKLSWSPVRVHIGQAGAEGADPTEYPAFKVELGGGDFADLVRRDGPDQVSESQREFIDLAFRMALIDVTSLRKAGSIIIDAPESSLDAVFVERAASVLARFANANNSNRLVVTSNLAAGELIPVLLKAADPDPVRRRNRIVDLFKEGVPTRAMKELSVQYEGYRSQLYEAISKEVDVV